MEHRSLFGGLEFFDGLNTRLTNIETNIASTESNIMTELNGEKWDLATFKNDASGDMHEIKNVNRKIKESQDLVGKSMNHSRRRSMT